MHRAPLLPVAVAFLAGVLLDQRLIDDALVLCALALLLARRPHALIVAGLLGILVSLLRGHPMLIDAEAHTARYSGTIVGDIRRGDDGPRTFPFALADGRVVTVMLANGDVVAGERLVLRGRLQPYDEPRNPGEPSLRAIEAAEGIAGELAAAHIVSTAGPDPRDVRTWMPRLRARASTILRSRIAEPSATILAGALWGERGTLPPELHDAFQTTGTVHVLVTAGLHLGVIAALTIALLAWCHVPRRTACCVTIAFVFAYAAFSGWHLPSQRAAVMIGVALAARAYGARSVSWNTVAIAAIVVAALWPLAVASVSFALSFSCVAAILLFAGPIASALERLRVPHVVGEAVALTIATQIGVWPLTAAVFTTLAPYAVVANAVIVPLIGTAMAGGLVAMAIPFVAPLESWLLIGIAGAVQFAARLPGAHASIAQPAAWSIAAYDAVALTAATFFARGRAAAGLATLAGGCAIVVGSASIHPARTLTITYLDVGQGDGAVIRTPNGAMIVIDSGGRLERGALPDGRSPAEAVGERVVLAYLRRSGVQRVDVLVNSHPHGDHVGGCAPIVRALPVGRIIDGGQRYGGRAFTDCLSEARAHNVPITIVRRGDRFSIDGVDAEVLAPESPLVSGGTNDINENSVVLRLGYGPFHALFTGDAGTQAEARLLKGGDDLEADVLKVGHHGSAYASTPAFIAAVRPRLAVISVGRHNLFGHPAAPTLRSYAAFGVPVLRTDRCGAVTVHVNDGQHVSTMIPCVSAIVESSN